MHSQTLVFVTSGPLVAAAVFVRIAVGALLLVAGTAKIRAGESRFFQVVLAYDLLPRIAARWLARLLPLAEVGVGLLLILGLLTVPATLAGLLLLLTFTSATALALARGKEIPCGCFGLRETVRPMRWTIVLRNLILILGLLAVLVAGDRLPAVDRLLSGLGITSQWLAGLAVACAVALSIRSLPTRKRELPISIA
jgi:uncharacterized membrane protein YphA (DoxX/SURF4 family)